MNSKRVYACRSCNALFVYVCSRSYTQTIPREQWLSVLCKGCFVNIQDSNKRWSGSVQSLSYRFVGVISRVEEDHVVVSYYSWNSSFCERIEKKDARLQPYLTTVVDEVIALLCTPRSR